MGKTNKHISETAKRRDHPVNETDVDRAPRVEDHEVRGESRSGRGRSEGDRDQEVPDGPLISRDPGTLLNGD